jgi:hypothetical protein
MSSNNCFVVGLQKDALSAEMKLIDMSVSGLP